MLPTISENLELGPRPYRTHKEAAELLAALRAAYQSLSPRGRSLVKGVSQMANVQFTTALD